MDFNEIYLTEAISFEIFPPKTDEGVKNLFAELDILTEYKPAFISVTYGAGGSTQEKTLDLALEIRERYGIKPLVHFTCVGAGRADIQRHLDKIRELGLIDILALRGDPPKGQTDFVPAADGFSYANELVEFIAAQGGFNIAVAGYPDKHQTAPDFDADVANLKRKIDAGASLVLTQLFFNNDSYTRLVSALSGLGSSVPVIPGIVPMTDPAQIEKLAQMCGASVPEKFASDLRTSANPFKTGVDYAIAQCLDLRTRGIKGFHFYPLNKAKAVAKVLDAIL
jgi:methylenetetrahydrofolate reductase (NADPH)